MQRDASGTKKMFSILYWIAQVTKLLLLTFVIDRFLSGMQLTTPLYGEQAGWQLFPPLPRMVVVVLIVTQVLKKMVKAKIVKEEVVIVKEFGV